MPGQSNENYISFENRDLQLFFLNFISLIDFGRGAVILQFTMKTIFAAFSRDALPECQWMTVPEVFLWIRSTHHKSIDRMSHNCFKYSYL